MSGTEGRLTHLDARGAAHMVDVGDKPVTVRRALARGQVRASPEALRLLRDGGKKGDALAVARVAAIQAAKRTPEWIPLCHHVPLDRIAVHLDIDDAAGVVRIEVEVRATHRTGVEMEALVAVAAAGLTLIDMAKAVDRTMVIDGITLIEKDGGRSGPYRREGESP